MTTLAVAPSLLDRLHAQRTLDEVLAGVWEGLVAHRVVECPICRSEMDPEYGAHARVIAGRCRDCGSSLS